MFVMLRLVLLPFIFPWLDELPCGFSLTNECQVENQKPNQHNRQHTDNYTTHYDIKQTWFLTLAILILILVINTLIYKDYHINPKYEHSANKRNDERDEIFVVVESNAVI